MAVVRQLIAQHEADCAVIKQFIQGHIPDMMVSPSQRITWDSHGMPNVERLVNLTYSRLISGVVRDEAHHRCVGDLQSPAERAAIIHFITKCKALQ